MKKYRILPATFLVLIFATLVACTEPKSTSEGSSVSSKPHSLENLRVDEVLRPLLPAPFRGRRIEVDTQEPEPSRYFVATLVDGGDYSAAATISVSVPSQGPLTETSMDEDASIYSPFNASFVFERVSRDRRAEFGTYSYSRTNGSDPSNLDWMLYSDAVNIGLSYAGFDLSEADLWNMASAIRQYLYGPL